MNYGEIWSFMRNNKYHFDVPDSKKVRMIVHTDCKNEADDQFALAHHLMTPKFIVEGIVAGHFDVVHKEYEKGTTAKESLKEVNKVLELMGLASEYKSYLGASTNLKDEFTPIESEGAKFIVETAMKEDSHPLFIACQGSVTDVASAILMEPKICDRMTVLWIGGGPYPAGGPEFNVQQDIAAANVLLKSSIPIWQVPSNVYKQMTVSLAELELYVRPCGELGRYLFDQMVEVNEKAAHVPFWPNGETWDLGDSPTIGLLLESPEKTDIYDEVPAPTINYEDMTYNYDKLGRKIRVYNQVNSRLILNDFFAKLRLNYGE